MLTLLAQILRFDWQTKGERKWNKRRGEYWNIHHETLLTCGQTSARRKGFVVVQPVYTSWPSLTWTLSHSFVGSIRFLTSWSHLPALESPKENAVSPWLWPPWHKRTWTSLSKTWLRIEKVYWKANKFVVLMDEHITNDFSLVTSFFCTNLTRLSNIWRDRFAHSILAGIGVDRFWKLKRRSRILDPNTA